MELISNMMHSSLVVLVFANMFGSHLVVLLFANMFGRGAASPIMLDKFLLNYANFLFTAFKSL